MKTIKSLSWCDHPLCVISNTDDYEEKYPDGQEVRPTLIWVYTPGRGRKTHAVRVDLCEVHAQELKDTYMSLRKIGTLVPVETGVDITEDYHE